jgi:hypothetical protein
MRPLSVDEQDQKLRADCPQFKLATHAKWIGVWEGTLRPICQAYRIRIIYFSLRQFDGWYLDHPYVSVFVIDPPIGRDPRGTGEPGQHVYRYRHHPDFPALCLYDPVEDAWRPSEPIVERIIPWTIKWLFFHEEWLLSGEWKGGGGHPESAAPCPTQEDLDPESHARRDQLLNGAFHRLGRRIGTFASCLLMEAASGGSFPPPSWRNLRGVTPAEVQSVLASILLQVPQQAVFLRLAWVPDLPQTTSSTSTSEGDMKSFLPSPSLRSAA